MMIAEAEAAATIIVARDAATDALNTGEHLFVTIAYARN